MPKSSKVRNTPGMGLNRMRTGVLHSPQVWTLEASEIGDKQGSRVGYVARSTHDPPTCTRTHRHTHLCFIRVVQLLVLAVVPPTPRTVKAAETCSSASTCLHRTLPCVRLCSPTHRTHTRLQQPLAIVTNT